MNGYVWTNEPWTVTAMSNWPYLKNLERLHIWARREQPLTIVFLLRFTRAELGALSPQSNRTRLITPIQLFFNRELKFRSRVAVFPTFCNWPKESSWFFFYVDDIDCSHFSHHRKERPHELGSFLRPEFLSTNRDFFTCNTLNHCTKVSHWFSEIKTAKSNKQINVRMN